MSIVLNFESFPPGPNEHMHYAKKAKITKYWRNTAKEQLLKLFNGKVPFYSRARVSAVIIRTRLGVADYDNDLSRLKPIMDGVVDSGLIKNDTRAYVVWGHVKEERGKAAMSVTLEEVGIGCTRCGSITDDVEPFLFNTFFCLKCYGKLALSYLGSHGNDTLDEWLKEWLRLKNA